MNNRVFYAYCRETRKVEQDPPRRAALWDVYSYMRECGVTRPGVRQFIARRIFEETGNELKIEAFEWVLAQFEGTPPPPAAVNEGQEALL